MAPSAARLSVCEDEIDGSEIVLTSAIGRNDKFLKDLRDHAMSIFAGAIVINSTPKILKPVTGTLVGWTTWFLFEKTLKTCLPFVKERLAETAKLKADPSYNWTPPVSVTMALNEAIVGYSS
jgi:hypothetical protein